MIEMSRRRRPLVALAILVCGLTLAGGAAAGVTPAQLTDAGWTCFNDPTAPRIVCADPGHGRPFPENPDAPPSYSLRLFQLDGTFIGTLTLIRADLYHGQPCASTGGDYTFIPPIGYYRCEHF
jgi:hypothetical protein